MNATAPQESPAFRRGVEVKLRMCRTWRDLLTAAEDNRLRRTDTDQVMHDPPSGANGLPIRQPTPAAQLAEDGVRAGWLELRAMRYRRTPDGDAALRRIQARIDEAANVTVRSCR